MTQSYWLPSQYATPSDSDGEANEGGPLFSNNDMINLDLGYGNLSSSNSSGRMQLQSTTDLMQTILQPSNDVHHRLSSLDHAPNDTIFHHSSSSNSGIPSLPSFATPVSSSGYPFTTSLANPSSPSFHQQQHQQHPEHRHQQQQQQHSSSLYDGSYHLVAPTSSRQTFPTTTTTWSQSFPQPLFDFRSRIGSSIHQIPGMVPPMRNNPFPNPPSPLRNEYPSGSSRQPPAGVNPFQLTSSPSPPLSLISRGGYSGYTRTSPSASTYGYSSGSMLHESPSMSPSSRDVPPFEATKFFHHIVDEAGINVEPEIHAKIDKGFFRADSDWCCYRRNYFSVACSYKLNARQVANHENLFLQRTDSRSDLRREHIDGFYISIAACVDGEGGRSIELVQHTPKRDKGPMSAPDKVHLKPNPSGALSPYPGPGYGGLQYGSNEPYDAYNNTGGSEPTVVNFDRIQFKKATANNGKRRAAQQYFQIMVELFVKVSRPGPDEFVKVAHRVSEQMVVRGRSPGHYADGGRSSSNMGGGTGASGGFGSMSRDSGMNTHGSHSGNHYSSGTGGHTFYPSHSHDHVGSYSGLPAIFPSIPGSNWTDNQSFLDSAEPGMTIRFPEDRKYSTQYGGISCDQASRGTTVASNASSPSRYETPGSYLTMSPVKEDTFIKQDPKLAEKLSVSSPLQLPMLGAWAPPDREFQSPPQDCRTWQTQSQRHYPSTMSAL